MSLPDISLLEPLAEALDVSVTELLHGERQCGEKTVKEQHNRDLTAEVLLEVGIALMFGPWFFWIMPERLPSYYDVMSLSYFSYGGMHINMPGMRFNNRNWPHILKAWRGFGFLVPAGWPLCWLMLGRVFRYRPLLEMGGADAVLFIPLLLIRVLLPLAVILGGLFVPTYVAGKKYE